MDRALFRAVLAAALLALLASGPLALRAAAHETRTVGAYSLEVGWQREPAVAGQPNGLFLSVHDQAGGPVTGLATTLQAEVISGGGAKRLALPLTADPERPGEYVGAFIPTRAGDYTFHLSGAIAAQKVDERFESGPGRFDSVTDARELQFPDPQPAPADLGARIDALGTKLNAAIGLASVALALAIVSFVRARR